MHLSIVGAPCYLCCAVLLALFVACHIYMHRELHKRVSSFMLRRTQEVLSKHLPPLAVHTMFCRPSALQVCVYLCCVIV